MVPILSYIVASLLAPYFDTCSSSTSCMNLFNFATGMTAFLFVIVAILVFVFIYDNLRRSKVAPAAV